MGIREASIHTILHDHLQMTKISAVWVPKLLDASQRAERVNIGREFSVVARKLWRKVWRRIVTVDESRLPFFNPETKQQSKQWRKKDQEPPIKPRQVPSVEKAMITVFWDCDGIILIDYLPQERTINAEYYSHLLRDCCARH